MTASDGGDDSFVARWVSRNRQGSAPDLPAMSRGAHARSVSNTSSSSDEDEGVRLSTLSLNDPVDRVDLQHSATIDHAVRGSQNMFSSGPLVTESRHLENGPPSRFELGNTPSGDVFLASSGQPSDGHQGNSRLAIIQREVIAHSNGNSLGSPLRASTGHQGNSPITVIQRDVATHGNGNLGSPAHVLRNRASNNNISFGSPAHVLRNRSSNISGRHQVGGVDAQGIYSHTACVFVANLPEPKEDRALEAAVTREFSKYGTVFVKIRRDPHHMPFAFCQFTNSDDAKVAMELAKGAMILGRPCRTEMVKANRAFFIHRLRGNPITIEEAKQLMEQFGALLSAEYSARLQSELGVDAVVIVEFATFDPTRDLQSAFRNSDTYHVDAFDSRKGGPARRTDADEVFLNQYEIDRRSIFVGNLPVDIDENAVKELFSGAGTVIKVQLIKKSTDYGTRAFAFIEFDRADTPETAVSRFHNHHFRGCQIRVERKVGRDQAPRRVRSLCLIQNRSADKASDKLTPTTPRAQPSVGSLAQRNATDGQSTPGLAQPASPAWNWMYPAQSPTQLAFNSQAFIGGSATSYGQQIGHPTAPVTPQSPESFSPYTPGYYSPIWPGIPFVQNPVVGAMPSFYPTYGNPTVAGLLNQEGSNETVNTSTRTHRETTENHDVARGDANDA